MTTVWLTYAWSDNTEGDVEFIAQELGRAGLDVRLDRWTLTAGKRLWEQIGEELSKPDLAAWIIYATPNSCGSEPCNEELAYALDRALGKQGKGFPVIALFPSTVNADLLPPSLKTRLCVTTTDPSWVERCKATAERRTPAVARQEQEPYFCKVHHVQGNAFGRYAIEIRPRAGSWSPFFAAIPAQEKEIVKMKLAHGARNLVPSNAIVLYNSGEVNGSKNGLPLWGRQASNEATPTMSYYVFCEDLPSALAFGALNTQATYEIHPKTLNP